MHAFNLALLGKWRREFFTDSNREGAKILSFNYQVPSWDLFQQPKGKVSFFWSRVSHCLLAFGGCVSVKVKSGSKSLFWKNRWFKELTPMNLWPEELLVSSRPNGTVRELAHLLVRLPFVIDPVAA